MNSTMQRRHVQTLAATLALSSLALPACRPASNGPIPADPAAGRANETRNAKLPADARFISAGLGIYLTPAGQQYIYSNTKKVVDLAIEGEQFGTTHGEYDHFKYVSPKAYTEARMRQLLSSRMTAAEAAKTAAAFESAQKAIKKWLEGFELNDPKFKITVDGSTYDITYSRFGLRFDSEMARANGITNGVVLVAEIEAPKIQVRVPKVRATDLNNSWLGQFGFDTIKLGINSTQKPLRVQFPVAITITARDGLDVKALPAITNVDKVAITSSYAKMVFPPVSIVINGQESQLNTDPLEKAINEKKAELVKGLQVWAKEFAKDELPELAQKQIDAYSEEFRHGYTAHMGAASAPNAQSGLLVLGLKPAEIKMRDGNVVIEADAAMEDPIQRVSAALPTNSGVRDVPSIPSTQSHAMVALKSDLLNRMLQHSYNRGYFASVDIGSTKLRMLQTPTFKLDGTAGSNKGILHLKARAPAPRTLFATDGYVIFDVDLIVRFEAKNNALRMIKERVDLDSLVVSDESINWLGSRVRQGVRDEIKSANDDYARSVSKLCDDMTLPKDVGGVPLVLNGVKATNGYLFVAASLGAIPAPTPAVRP